MVSHYLIPETWLLNLESKEEIIATGINTISAMARAWGELGNIKRVEQLRELVVQADDLPWLPFCRRSVDFEIGETVYGMSGVGLSSQINTITHNKNGLFKGKIGFNSFGQKGIVFENFGFHSFCLFEKGNQYLGNQYLITGKDLKYIVAYRKSFGNKWLQNSYPEEKEIVENIIFREFSIYRTKKQFFRF